MSRCFIRWTDENGGIHETEKFDNMMVALHVSRKDAERLGLEMKKVDGVEVRQIITTEFRKCEYCKKVHDSRLACPEYAEASIHTPKIPLAIPSQITPHKAGS